MSRLVFALSVTLATSCAAHGQTRPVYTQTSGAACRNESREYERSWTCPGPAGYTATFLDEGNVVGISLGRAGAAGPRPGGVVWRGAGRLFGDLIEWRIGVDGAPVAAIIRTWETADSGVTEQALRVLAIRDGAACEFGRVVARRRNANRQAAALAERAVDHKCGL